MTLPNAILFPDVMLPLHIFEPRYQVMLSDSLKTHRMFSVAMQKPGRVRETPSNIAGLGLIRVSVGNRDGTSNLILQGLARIELAETVRNKPYRINRIRPLQTTGDDSIAVDALTAKVLELVAERLENAADLPLPALQQFGQLLDVELGHTDPVPVQELMSYLATLENPDHLADLVSFAFLPRSSERQVILEALDLEERLKHLVHFLIAENSRNRKNKGP